MTDYHLNTTGHIRSDRSKSPLPCQCVSAGKRQRLLEVLHGDRRTGEAERITNGAFPMADVWPNDGRMTIVSALPASYNGVVTTINWPTMSMGEFMQPCTSWSENDRQPDHQPPWLYRRSSTISRCYPPGQSLAFPFHPRLSSRQPSLNPSHHSHKPSLLSFPPAGPRCDYSKPGNDRSGISLSTACIAGIQVFFSSSCDRY